MKRVILTGDDFGLAVPVNEAIIAAHRAGSITTASLMVGAAAAPDAVGRALETPSLKIGLHVTLIEGRPVLPPHAIPDIVDPRGEFFRNPTAAGFRFFFHPRARRQLEMEIRAQFEAFRKTGLTLDHVNAHNHMHLHPTVLRLILKVGGEFGAKAVRLPNEPPLRSWRASGTNLMGKLATWLFLSPWVRLVRNKVRGAGMDCNDFVFGMAGSGAMSIRRVLKYLELLPEGTTELYFHPATRRCPELDITMSDYDFEGEYRALVSDALGIALRRARVEQIAFAHLRRGVEPPAREAVSTRRVG
jgi:chitin disaccharide deacetylase